MKEKELNILLLEEFPDIKESFENEVSWQDGLDTGCTVTFADVFIPYIATTAYQNDNDKIAKIFGFIEKLASLNDEYVNQVILLSVFDPLFDDYDDIAWNEYFGESTKKLYELYQN